VKYPEGKDYAACDQYSRVLFEFLENGIEFSFSRGIRQVQLESGFR